jgi:hypothetical protein
MPFGTPGTFQIFGDLIDRWVLVYIDDILIYTKDLESHLEILEEVFRGIKKYQLQVKRINWIF